MTDEEEIRQLEEEIAQVRHVLSEYDSERGLRPVWQGFSHAKNRR